MNIRPWRQRYNKNMDEAEDPARPVDMILVDQIKSPMPRLISKMTGFLTKNIYQYATVYVDQYFRLRHNLQNITRRKSRRGNVMIGIKV